MRAEDTSGSDGWKNTLPVEWHDCVWPATVELNQAESLRRYAITKPLPMPAFLPHPTRRKNLFKLMKKNPSSQRRLGAGFTLVELLTVIAIIAILAAMLLPAISHVQTAAKKAKAKIEANDIATAIQAYDAAYGRFPVSAQAQTQASQNANSGLNPDFTYGGSFFDPSGNAVLIGTQVGGKILTNSEVIAILMNYTNYPNSSGGATINTNYQKNPQKTIFLNAKLSGWDPSQGGTPLPGVDNNLVYRDPWGNPYIITMDLNYDEQCRDTFYSLSKVSNTAGANTNPGLNGLTDPDGTAGNFLFHGKVMVWSAGPPVAGKAVVDVTTPANSPNNKSHVLSWQ